MRKTEKITIYPWNKGLDTTSIPGAQDRSSLTEASNIVLRNNGSRIKRPGIREIEFMGLNDGNLRGITDFHATNGSGQYQEIIRVINGRVEALRNNEFIDLGLTGLSEYDAVGFERFVNSLIVNFENTRPYYYNITDGLLTALPIPESHQTSPPKFSRVHDFRLFYAGRSNNPHILTASVINDFSDYRLYQGGMSIRVRDGDGDPVGITGISPPFRGDLFVFKSQSLYRIYHTDFGYGVDLLSDQVGCICHNSIVATQNDIFWVSDRAIHSLVMTSKYGAAEEYTVTYPIYEQFIESVNWAAAKYMWATYDIFSNCYLLAYASSGSSTNDRILGFNVQTKEFFEWGDQDYSCIAKYLDENKRRRTMVALSDGRMGYFDETTNADFEEPVNMSFSSALIFPKGSPSTQVNFTKAKLMGRPTMGHVDVDIEYEIDGVSQGTTTVDTHAEGYGAEIGAEDAIGTAPIGGNRNKIFVREIDLQGTGSSIQFNISQEPPDTDKDQPCEIFGIEFEFDYSEDTGETTQV